MYVARGGGTRPSLTQRTWRSCIRPPHPHLSSVVAYLLHLQHRRGRLVAGHVHIHTRPVRTRYRRPAGCFSLSYALAFSQSRFSEIGELKWLPKGTNDRGLPHRAVDRSPSRHVIPFPC
ncbi:hypothetical protein CPAR01_03199 [Colletotrichum paranaense]|uniref:Uncharacterized protein n=3 Tax=Colletotrichum acutatum species complex TaxID=2707335 RepID=A0AAI9YHI6_9PEZI|nr:uncharacterized protein CCOS01_15218 [Colletotrichum costaricense]XP_060354814.1 uncharacterized protein CPAR01_03199 [Colletotrichum paranaense]XP_060380159.1 uncharacterized protein CTAM01_09196 [Colletotrichum tamarilloi]KAI3527928.1 hypothetical protein CSPX01_16609 [Colletotrichum filicis]KAK1494005.1 hypothetical protein CTAM01_09196 [Colletotrichum tamarilloi]KAK1510387.1 hypothetical protein CCOS01_15218 [Colletotrichum costaricense]KAK1545697.1 hypothetical protein CPAR01_03199 [C